MNAPVLTPLSQAMEGAEMSRAELKRFMRRRNGPGLARLALWALLLTVTSALVALSIGTVWMVPAMFVQGVVLVHHFSLQHECTHYTAFRTRWLNDLVGWGCGISIGLAPRFFRYEHCDHHTYTQTPGRDPEMLVVPKDWREYITYLSAVPYWWTKGKELVRHASGRITPAEAVFVPKVEYARVFLEARLLLGLYALVAATMVLFSWWAPLWFWVIPLALGEPVMRFIRMTEHVACPQVADMRVNTRTSRVGSLWRFLCWNMNYHAEHHFAASVPFHALPALHERLNGTLNVGRGGYVGAHRDIVAAMRGGAGSAGPSPA